MDAEGGATPEFAKSQVSYALQRKFTWLTPLTRTKCLLLLDMYEEQSDPIFRNVIKYRDDKFTHQIEVTKPETVDQASAAGWFRLAYNWGAKRR